ncbi:MAG TPA: adenylate/guanylate cyclase domain-containing protein [Candidatus Limnocylindria bacterium]
MSDLPTGTVTFFFSDIEGSTRLLERLGDDFSGLLERHREIVRDRLAASAGVEMGTEGDSFFAVFPSARDAVAASVDIQRAMASEDWPRDSTLRVRIGLHSGEARVADATYVGLDVHRAARIMAAAHGGQVLMSSVTRSLVERSLGDGIRLRDLGEHRLRDLSGSESLSQASADDLESEFPPLRTLGMAPNNLPMPTSRLVGRQEELAAIRGYLDSSDVRLLTLTGPGGIGKTRLSLQAAAEQIDRFPDGVFFVDLSAARDSATALEAVVRVVGVTVSSEDQLGAALARQLEARQLLLLLDNFEQVMTAADDVAQLVKLCPMLKALVTSREALRVRGEQLYPVASLSVPTNGQTRATADELSRYEAIRLFVERAQEARPSFELTDDNASAIVEICARLDGLPLAIELAAAHLNLFSPRDLRDRLQGRLELLRGGARDLPARQRTLRSTIEWSYELLDDDERRVFQLLSLFSSARIDGVEQVAARIDALAGVDVLDRIATLVDKNLVRSLEDRDGQRLSMLETIRAFAAEQLEADPGMHAAAAQAHAEYFAELSEASRGDLRGPRRDVALDRLASELGNLQRAWRHYVDAADVAALNKLLDPLWSLHDARGWYHGSVALANDLLGVLSRGEPAPDRAEDEITLRVTLARALLALWGYTDQVEELYRDALDLSQAAGAVPRRLPVLRSLASFYLYRADIAKTAEIGREMLALAEQEHDTSLEVEGHLILGPALAFLGEGRVGLDHLDRAIALFDPKRDGRAPLRLGPNPGVAARAVAGLINWLFGYPDTAARRAASALELAEELHHPYSLAWATFHVALLDLWSGRVDLAHERAGAVIRIAEEHDYQIWKAIGLTIRGVTISALGDPEKGLTHTEEGIALYQHLRTPPVFWPALLSLRARACSVAGRTTEALEVLDQAAMLAAEGSWDSAGIKVQRADVLISLGDTQAAESWLQLAFAEAGLAGGRVFQLRAATRLARLADAAHQPDATARLREILDTFTEGFATPDVMEARALLDAASAQDGRPPAPGQETR